MVPEITSLSGFLALDIVKYVLSSDEDVEIDWPLVSLNFTDMGASIS